MIKEKTATNASSGITAAHRQRQMWYIFPSCGNNEDLVWIYDTCYAVVFDNITGNPISVGVSLFD